jgi:hypothetical protein
MKDLSDHTDLLNELLTSLLIKRIQIRIMARLGSPIGLVEHAMWADSFCVSYTCCYFQFPAQRSGADLADSETP